MPTVCMVLASTLVGVSVHHGVKHGVAVLLESCVDTEPRCGQGSSCPGSQEPGQSPLSLIAQLAPDGFCLCPCELGRVRARALMLRSIHLALSDHAGALHSSASLILDWAGSRP
eukprot:scaffold152453_cov24-Tisochrysis_lutea.AAC.1